MEEKQPSNTPAPSSGPAKPFKGRYNILNDPNTAPARIYVGNLSETIDEGTLRTRFGTYGQISDVLLKKGFAFIQFMSKDSAAEAIAKENKTTMLDKIIAVRTAVKKGNENESAAQPPNNSVIPSNNGPPKINNARGPPPSQQQQQPPALPFNHTVTSNHIEIMAMSRDFTEYAENIETYLKNKNLKVDILYPNPNVPMPSLLENIQMRGTLFALEIDEHNQRDETVTVYMLYHEKIKWQRDMRVQDALAHVQKCSEEYIQPSNSTPALDQQPPAAGSFTHKDTAEPTNGMSSTSSPQFKTYEGSMKTINEQVASLVKRNMVSVADLDNFIEQLRKMRRAVAVMENPLNPQPEPEVPEEDPVEQRIQGIIKSQNYLEQLSKPEPFVMTKERLALLQDPKIERALDTLLHPDIFSTLDLSFIKNM
ncbi:uncharacterized protein LOC134830902 [Culicoides brevitarsis]|uniref:uncharacterized protein LOC134830902 n=1 Tax=Culicoides brevitarsis TaxID=469753 RepID=UPI00307BE4E0